MQLKNCSHLLTKTHQNTQQSSMLHTCVRLRVPVMRSLQCMYQAAPPLSWLHSHCFTKLTQC